MTSSFRIFAWGTASIALATLSVLLWMASPVIAFVTLLYSLVLVHLELHVDLASGIIARQLLRTFALLGGIVMIVILFAITSGMNQHVSTWVICLWMMSAIIGWRIGKGKEAALAGIVLGFLCGPIGCILAVLVDERPQCRYCGERIDSKTDICSRCRFKSQGVL